MKIYQVTVRVTDQFQPRLIWEDRTIALEAKNEEEARGKAVRVAVKITKLAAPGWGKVLEVR